MKTSLDCVPCILRQTLDAARLISDDTVFHETILREIMKWVADIDFNLSPPEIAQLIHRKLRQISQMDDPYREIKNRQNAMAMEMIPSLRESLKTVADPFYMAVRLAIAGNMIDMGVKSNITEADVRHSIDQALTEPFVGDMEEFRQALAKAGAILYITDNAGEIAFDRLLIEQITPARVTVAVRGFPVINDATIEDARFVGLDEVTKVITNGTDAPGTILHHCSEEFRSLFNNADLIIAKGQGNFESMNSEDGNIFFLFKAKCSLISEAVQQPIGTQMLVHY